MIEDKVHALCPNALVHKRGEKYIVLLPLKVYEDRKAIEALFSVAGIENVEFHIRQSCEVYSRVMGYYRPTTEWNIGKQSEFKERKEFIVDEGHVRLF